MKKLTLILLSLLFCFVLIAQNKTTTHPNSYKGEISDMGIYFIANEENITPISEMLLSAEEDLTIVNVIYNWGPDYAYNDMSIHITIDGDDFGDDIIFDPTTETEDGYIGYPGAALLTTMLLTAEEMNTQGLATFEVCTIVTYSGNDDDATNNESCITVTRSVDIITSHSSKYAIFPNPANNVITVANAENTNITVVNMMGQVISTVKNVSENQTIDISNLAEGTYFVRVNSEIFKISVIK